MGNTAGTPTPINYDTDNSNQNFKMSSTLNEDVFLEIVRQNDFDISDLNNLCKTNKDYNYFCKKNKEYIAKIFII